MNIIKKINKVIENNDKRVINSMKINYFKNLIGKSDDDIINIFASSININREIVLLVDYNTLFNNMDFFLHLLSIINKMPRIKITVLCEEYRSALFINENLRNKSNMEVSLMDDNQMMQRFNIQPGLFDKCELRVPISYVMWGIDPYPYDRLLVNSYSGEIINGRYEITKAELLKLKEVVKEIKYRHDYSDVEKVLLVSDYLQSKVQYVEGSDTLVGDRIYHLTTDKIITPEIVSRIDSVLNKDIGNSVGIANATTLLLNNLTMRVDVRSIHNNNHAWNVVLIDGKYYYVDNAWNILFGKNVQDGSLQATSYNDEYLLFGRIMALMSGEHRPINNFPIEKSSYDYDEMVNVKSGLKNRIYTKYKVHPAIPSFRLK